MGGFLYQLSVVIQLVGMCGHPGIFPLTHAEETPIEQDQGPWILGQLMIKVIHGDSPPVNSKPRAPKSQVSKQ